MPSTVALRISPTGPENVPNVPTVMVEFTEAGRGEGSVGVSGDWLRGAVSWRAAGAGPATPGATPPVFNGSEREGDASTPRPRPFPRRGAVGVVGATGSRWPTVGVES